MMTVMKFGLTPGSDLEEIMYNLLVCVQDTIHMATIGDY